MARKDDARTRAGGQGRDDRLKAALKANMAKRKAQARARQEARGTRDEPSAKPGGETGRDERDG